MSSEYSTFCLITGNSFDMDAFGDRLKEALKTQEVAEIARLLGVTYQAAKNYVGGRVPSHETLISIANSTNCSIHWLLTGEGEKEIDATKDITFDAMIEDKIRAIVKDELNKRKGALTFTIGDEKEDKEKKAA